MSLRHWSLTDCISFTVMNDYQIGEALTGDPHVMVRGAAAWALGRIGSPDAIRRLRERSESEEDASVRSEIAAALEPFVSRAPLGST